MYIAPILSNGFNYQSFNYQPITNLIQMNEILRNQNEIYQAHGRIPTRIQNHQLNGKKHISPLLKDINNINHASKSTKTQQSSNKYLPTIATTHHYNQHRKLSRQSSLETLSTKHSIQLPSSRSLTTLQDRIQKERKAHTMAPLTRISGPSSTPKAKMFATMVAPIDARAMKSNYVAHDISKTITDPCVKSDAETTDDDAPIIVKVQYDPELGALPSEDVIRQAVDNQLNRRSDKTSIKDPIIVNFLGQNSQPPVQIQSHTSMQPQGQARPQMSVRTHIPVRPQIPMQPQIPVRPQLPIQPQMPIQSQRQVRTQVPVQPQVQFRPQIPIQPQKQVRPQMLIQPQRQVRQQMPIQPQMPVQRKMPIQPQGHIRAQMPVQPQGQARSQMLVRPQTPVQHGPSLRIHVPAEKKQQTYQQNPFPSQIAPRPSHILPSVSPVKLPPRPFVQNANIHPLQALRPLINQQHSQSIRVPRLPYRNISSAWDGGSYLKGFDTFKPINKEMASQQSSTTFNDQTLLRRPHTVASSGEIFRPPAVTDIPELSRDNLMNMLNQIPDLQGRRFNIEYAPLTEPEGYPIPSNLGLADNTYPEPVVIDRLPNNVIQHVKSSNNPALKAALEATIRREQSIQSTGQHQSNASALYAPPPTVMRHAAQPNQQVQQCRPASASDSDSSSTDTSSSETSSTSEETDTEESESVSSARPSNNIPFVGSFPSTSFSQNQYR